MSLILIPYYLDNSKDHKQLFQLMFYFLAEQFHEIFEIYLDMQLMVFQSDRCNQH